MQIYAVVLLVGALGLGLWKVYAVGAENAENANRLAANEVLREEMFKANERASKERANARAADERADEKIAASEARAEKAEEKWANRAPVIVPECPEVDLCPSECYKIEWSS